MGNGAPLALVSVGSRRVSVLEWWFCESGGRAAMCGQTGAPARNALRLLWSVNFLERRGWSVGMVAPFRPLCSWTDGGGRMAAARGVESVTGELGAESRAENAAQLHRSRNQFEEFQLLSAGIPGEACDC